jgi:hypothetical protein
MLRATGKNLTVEFVGSYPLFEVDFNDFAYTDKSQAVTLPDGRKAFVEEVNGWCGLFEEAVSMDGADNIHRKRIAAKSGSTAGIAVPTLTSGPFTVVGDKQIGWLKIVH